MKSILAFLCFIFCFTAVGQNPDLFNHTWYLQKMVINGTNIFPPSNSEVDYVDLYVSDNGNNTSMFETSICNSGIGDVIFDNNTATFDFIGFAISLGSCQLQENTDFEGTYFFNFYEDHQSDTFSYGIVNESNGSKTLTITNIIGDQAIYNNVFLSTKQFQNQKLTVYPNPVKNVLSVESNSAIERIVIYDMLGNKVLSFVKRFSSYNVSALQSGVYFLEIISDQGSTFKKILKK